MKPSQTFGTMLKSLRIQKDFTGVKLAEMAGISRITLRDTELGRHLLADKTIRRIAEALCTPAFPLIQAAAQDRRRVSIELDGQPESVKRLLYVLASRKTPLSEAVAQKLVDVLDQVDSPETDVLDRAA